MLVNILRVHRVETDVHCSRLANSHKNETQHVGGSTAIGPEDNQENAQTDVVCLTAQRECAQRQHAVGLQIAYVPAQGHQQ